MRAATPLIALIAAACHPAAPSSGGHDGPGDRLERAALARGVVSDPAHVDARGLYAREGDRVCVLPAGNDIRLGATVRFENGPACEATGTARRMGASLAITFGPACRFSATVDGDRITFPAVLPAGCDSLCTGRASLAGLTVNRLSPAVAEAAALRGAHGRALCEG